MNRRLTALLIFLSCLIMVSAKSSLLPKPKYVEKIPGKFKFTEQTQIICSDSSLHPFAVQLNEMLKPAMGLDLLTPKSNKKSVIQLAQLLENSQTGEEGYQLKVTSQKIEISAYRPAGFFYAFQSLLQLLPPRIYSSTLNEKINWNVDGILIKDKPTFMWRGVMLDVSRQFFSIDFLKKYIDWMAACKLNVFHLHLSDDEGWRVEIKSLPKLTEIGAWRGPEEALKPVHGSGNQRYGGFYTQAQLKDLIRYAANKHITIVPEIDLPGHSKSEAVSYPEILCLTNDTTESVQGVKNNVWCVGREENYEMLEKIISEMAPLFPSEYFHVGGDEVNHHAWETCPRCQELMKKMSYTDVAQLQGYFIKRMEIILNKYGKKMLGWDEILKTPNLDTESAVMAWNSVEVGKKALESHHKVIFAPSQYFYIDMAQGIGERGHNWATFLPLERVYQFPLPADTFKNLLGLQANLWAEYLDRPPYQTEYQSYPRLCALSELAWTGQNNDFHEFKNRLVSQHYERMYYQGIYFRLQPPEIKTVKGKYYEVNKIPNTVTYYTTDSLNKSDWQTFKNGMKKIPHNSIMFRSCFMGKIYSPIVSVSHELLAQWDENSLNETNTGILSLPVSKKINSTTEGSILLQYSYGGDNLAIAKIEIYSDNILKFSTEYNEPVILSSRSPEWKLAIPNELFKEKAPCRIVLHLAGEYPKDNTGKIFFVEN